MKLFNIQAAVDYVNVYLRKQKLSVSLRNGLTQNILCDAQCQQPINMRPRIFPVLACLMLCKQLVI
jgi:hypothetical protein